VACSQPIQRIGDLDGCYFAKGPNPIFEVRDAKLISSDVTSIVAIRSSTSDSSVISFSPGIRVTENAQKSMIVVRGSEVSGLAFQRGKERHILLGGSGFPVELEQRDCTLTT